MKKAYLKPVEAEKKLDDLTISEIIGRPAEPTRTLVRPDFPDARTEQPREWRLIDRLRELAKK